MNEIEIDLTPEMVAQEKFDKLVCDNRGIEYGTQMKELRLALKTEIYEAVNEWKQFKFWKISPQTNTEKLLEEYVDGLHFFLSIGNILQVPYIHSFVTVKKNVYEQLDALDFELFRVDESIHWLVSFGLYRGLAKMWGFDWEKDVIPKYYEKHKVNYERQANGY